MTTNQFCAPFIKHRDIPCDCAHPPLQCCVENYVDLPFNPPNDIRNGDVYVVCGTLVPYFYWNGVWYPFTGGVPVGDADWFVEGVGGPDYGLGLNTDTAYHNGPIAVNRTTARSTSALDMTGQFLADGTYTGVSAVPLTGAGGRTMWNPETASFRSGYVSGTQWDDVSIGTYSIALGYSCIASGSKSLSVGNLNQATNTAAVALNSENVASGYASFAANKENTASGQFSFVFGLANVASGIDSFCGGTSSSAQDDRSFTFGGESHNLASQSVLFGDWMELAATADRTVLFGWKNAGPVRSFSHANAFVTYQLRPFLWSPNSAPVDGDLTESQVSFWIDEVGNTLKFRVKYSDGVTLKTGSVALV